MGEYLSMCFIIASVCSMFHERLHEVMRSERNCIKHTDAYLFIECAGAFKKGYERVVKRVCNSDGVPLVEAALIHHLQLAERCIKDRCPRW